MVDRHAARAADEAWSRAGVRIILQIALLLAWAMPVVAAMTVWTWLFDRRSGVINWLLTASGCPSRATTGSVDPLTLLRRRASSSWSG